MNSRQTPQPLVELSNAQLEDMRNALHPRALANTAWFAIAIYVGWLRLKGKSEHTPVEHPFETALPDDRIGRDRRHMMLMSADAVASEIYDYVHRFDGSHVSATTIADELIKWVHNDSLAQSSLREAFHLFKRLLEMGEGLKKSPELKPMFKLARHRRIRTIDEISELANEFISKSKLSHTEAAIVITGQATQVMRDCGWDKSQFGLSDVLQLLKACGEITQLGDNASLNAALPKGLLDTTILAWFAYLENLFVMSPMALVSVGVAFKIYPKFIYNDEDGNVMQFAIMDDVAIA
ncbi:hypothetical protein [Reinekea sp. G2M2-21]|uniref:hypothetical protein n=1 Tax=Reinekea sp. G2M2-21 TaxID=2788942 RepID=UPI0018ABABFC|nr:hypothetical protein [Reinekea sp. G2M2-21]